MQFRQPPEDLQHALRRAAEGLGTSLVRLGYPNGGRDAVFAEANVTCYVASGFLCLDAGYSCYAEASHTRARRIDLLASNGRSGFAIEAKLFGNVGQGAHSLLNDVERLCEFAPRLSPLNGGTAPPDWWRSLDTRWGVILVGSHASQAVHDAWRALDPSAGAKALADRPTWEAEAFSLLLSRLSQLGALGGLLHVCDGSRWHQCADAYLLSAVFPLA